MPIKLHVDLKKCVGHSRCAAKAPLVYDVDDDGAAPSDGKVVSSDLAEMARLGARVCPERAITLEEIPE